MAKFMCKISFKDCPINNNALLLNLLALGIAQTSLALHSLTRSLHLAARGAYLVP